MSEKMPFPERSCVLCRRKFPKKELIRFVLVGEEITIDDSSKAPGRGAYLCKDCLPFKDNTKVSHKLRRALRRGL